MVFILSVFSLFYCFALSKAQEKEKTMRKNNKNIATATASTTASIPFKTFEQERADKAAKLRKKKLDKALGRGKDGKYHISGNVYQNRTDACLAGRITISSAITRIAEAGMTYGEATDFPRFAVMEKGNDRPSIPQPPRQLFDATKDPYLTLSPEAKLWARMKPYNYDPKANEWVDPLWKNKGRALRYKTIEQMARNHGKLESFVREGVFRGFTLKEILAYDLQSANVPTNLGTLLTDPATGSQFWAFSIGDARMQMAEARGMVDRVSAIDYRKIWKLILLDKMSFDEALSKCFDDLGPKQVLKPKYEDAQYGYVVLQSGNYVSKYWVDPNTGTKFQTFGAMCKAYVTTPAKIKKELAKGTALGTALVKTGVPLSRGAKEVFAK